LSGLFVILEGRAKALEKKTFGNDSGLGNFGLGNFG